MLSLLRRTAPSEPASIEILHGDRIFAVGLRRRRTARRLTLRVAGPDAITLTIPEDATLASARRFAAGQAGWIAARLARLPQPIALVPDAVVPFRGEPHRIVHGSAIRGATRAAVDVDGGPILAVSGDAAGVPGRLRRFLAGQALADLTMAVSRHAGQLGVPVGRIAIRDTRSRWGSCSSSGTLSFSWRLILAPPLVLDYLAAHEVAHLKELNHSQRFWRIVHELCPATDEAERWLKRNGNGLHRYG